MQTIAVVMVGLIMAAILVKRYKKYLKDKDELKEIRRHNEFLQHNH